METQVAQHYASPDLARRIRAGLDAIGKSTQGLSPKDLGAVDQLHTGGGPATISLAQQAGLPETARVLDAGCGIGGSSRILAQTFGHQVTGIDLAEDFVETARILTQWCGLDQGCTFDAGSVLDLPYESGSFDAVFCQHILMNIEDKETALAEFFRVLKPGGRLVLHEITKGPGPAPLMPVPWARDPSISFILPWDDLYFGLARAGFTLFYFRDETGESAAWWQKINEIKAKTQGKVRPLNPGLIFGKNAARFGPNMEKNFSDRAICCIGAVLTRP